MVSVRHVALLVVLLWSSSAMAETGRPTIQNRFAEKRATLYAHATGMTQLRNDFYTTFGLGLDVGGYFNETLGLEFRGVWLSTSLSDQALDVKERTGLTPDARPQDAVLAGGARLSLGYGKLLVEWGDVVIHFDPQVTAHGGVTLAENRVLPTFMTSFALLMHFRAGIQVKLDLTLNTQIEDRDRGRIVSFGFVPFIGVGWSFSLLGGES